jgi:hypothetical protein
MGGVSLSAGSDVGYVEEAVVRWRGAEDEPLYMEDTSQFEPGRKNGGNGLGSSRIRMTSAWMMTEVVLWPSAPAADLHSSAGARAPSPVEGAAAEGSR